MSLILTETKKMCLTLQGRDSADQKSFYSQCHWYFFPKHGGLAVLSRSPNQANYMDISEKNHFIIQQGEWLNKVQSNGISKQLVFTKSSL